MSVAQKSFKAAVVAPLVLAAFATCANAESWNAELSDLDLSKPLPSGTCFNDNAQGSAISKLMQAMKERNQKSVVILDKVEPTRQIAQIYTSDLVKVDQNIPNLFGEGYEVTGNNPKAKVSSTYCVDRFSSTYIVNNDAIVGVPGVYNSGELGAALNRGSKSGAGFAFGALTDVGTLMAVNFNSKTQDGGVLLSDGAGNKVIGYPAMNVGYSPNLTADSRLAIGLPAAIEPLAFAH